MKLNKEDFIELTDAVIGLEVKLNELAEQKAINEDFVWELLEDQVKTLEKILYENCPGNEGWEDRQAFSEHLFDFVYNKLTGTDFWTYLTVEWDSDEMEAVQKKLGNKKGFDLNGCIFYSNNPEQVMRWQLQRAEEKQCH